MRLLVGVGLNMEGGPLGVAYGCSRYSDRRGSPGSGIWVQ